MIRILMLWFGWFLILVPSALVLVAAVVIGLGFIGAEEMGVGAGVAISATIFGIGVFQAAAPIVAGMLLVALAKMMKPEQPKSRPRRRRRRRGL